MRGASLRDAEREKIARYLEGAPPTVREVDRWIRTELRVRFPVLRQDAEDLAQTVHRKLVENFRKEDFRHRSTLKTYVVMVTRYTAVDRTRTLQRWSLLDADDALLPVFEDSPYRRLYAAERRILLRQVLMLVPAACRDLWILAYVQSLPYSEIARRLSLPPGTVKSRMWACKRRALALLDRLGQSSSEPGGPP